MPRIVGLNWFIPALAKQSVGSSCRITETDASSSGLGSILAQKQEDGTIQPIDYAN